MWKFGSKKKGIEYRSQPLPITLQEVRSGGVQKRCVTKTRELSLPKVLFHTASILAYLCNVLRKRQLLHRSNMSPAGTLASAMKSSLPGDGSDVSA